MNSGLTNPHIKSLAVTPNGYLFAGTYGSGVFRSTHPTTSVREIAGEIPIAFSLGQNYPNPFNPSTTIEFSLPHSEYVTLKIFDILGREVAVLADQRLQAGVYTKTWNAQKMPSGVYLVRMQAGTFSETKRLVLLK
jgi:hypothetical protein